MEFYTDLTLRFKPDGTAFIVGMRQMVDESKKTGEGIQRGLSPARTMLENICGQISGARNALLSLAGLHFGREFIADIIEANSQLGGFTGAMRQALGSHQAAAEATAFVRAETERLGTSLAEGAGAFSRLAAAAKGTALEGQGTRDVFRAVSEASRAMGLSQSEAQSALDAMTRMMNKGVVTSRELQMQLSGALPGAMRVAAEAMGVTTAQLNQMMEDGEITADQLLPRLAARLHELYGAAAEAAAGWEPAVGAGKRLAT
jgi:tape measure domain-containing protein